MASYSVDESALKTLKEALTGAGVDYKRNLARLTNLIGEITRGDITGDPANDLKAKFEAKQDIFNGVISSLEKAEEHVGVRTTQFEQLISGLASEMK